MKAITLTPPYGSLIALAADHPDLGKRIESRSWATKYRGPLAIHQAVSLKPVGGMRGLLQLLDDDRFWPALHQIAPSVFRTPGFVHYLPRGRIVATCELLDCVPIGVLPDGTPTYMAYDEWPPALQAVQEPERSFGIYEPGRWAWLLGNIRALPVPIPARGYQRIWNWEGSLV